MKIFKKLFYLLKFYTMYSYKKREMNDAVDNYADLLVLNPNALDTNIPKKVWMYWEGQCPVFVEICVARIRQYNPEYEVYFLTPDTVKEFCDIDYRRLQYTTPQQKADLIRFELIYQYGGIWLDASSIVYQSFDWIQDLVSKNQSNSFAYYRKKNTTNTAFPVVENWMLASVAKNIFFKQWFDELLNALELTPKKYIQQIREVEEYPQDFFQEIGRLEYLVAYVACQKVMRQNLPSMTLINCDQNALFYQVKNKWIKERFLIDIALNYPPVEYPYLIKLTGKERNLLSHYYTKNIYLKDSLLDI